MHFLKLSSYERNKHFVFLTSYADKETLEQAKMVKPFNEKNILAMLEMAISNFAHPQKVRHPGINPEKINSHQSSPLSEREFEVLNLIYKGNTNQQIAEVLFVYINTIIKHINNTYRKLDTQSRTGGAIVSLREFMRM